MKRLKELVREQNFELKPLPGILFEILMARFPKAVYVEFDKENLEESIGMLNKII